MSMNLDMSLICQSAAKFEFLLRLQLEPTWRSHTLPVQVKESYLLFPTESKRR